MTVFTVLCSLFEIRNFYNHFISLYNYYFVKTNEVKKLENETKSYPLRVRKRNNKSNVELITDSLISYMNLEDV